MNTRSIITVAVLLVTFSIIAIGCGHNHCCHRSPEKKAQWVVNRIAGKLDMTDSQEKKLEKIKDQVLAKMNDYKTEHQVMHDEALQLVKKDTLTRADLEKLFTQREQRYRELEPFIIEKMMEFHAILTPEQKNQLAEKMQEHYNERHGS